MFAENSMFEIKNSTLYFDSVDLSELSKSEGTPLYVFSERKIKENIELLQTSFGNYFPDSIIAYSMKNNTLPEIVSLIDEKLDSFETTSINEINIIKNIAKTTNKKRLVISTNIYKSDKLIDKLLDYSEDENLQILIALDSFQDLKNVERLARKKTIKPEVLIRVNPGIEMDQTQEIFASANITGKCAAIIKDIDPIKEMSNDPTIALWLSKRQKIPEKDYAENLIRLAASSEFLDLVGIHCHLGSQITTIEYFEQFFEVITKFFKLMNEKDGIDLKIIDFGGGYPLNYQHGECVPTIEMIAKSLSNHIKLANINPKIIIESGRFITANAAILLSKVQLIKESSSGMKLAVMDFSVYGDLLDILTAHWYYESYLVNDLPSNKNGKKITNWELVGETNDILDRLNPREYFCSKCKTTIAPQTERKFPRDLSKDDLIAITNVGAYTTCFNNTYSGRTHPKKHIITL